MIKKSFLLNLEERMPDNKYYIFKGSNRQEVVIDGSNKFVKIKVPKTPQQIISEKKDLFSNTNFKVLTDSNVPYFKIYNTYLNMVIGTKKYGLLTYLPNSSKRLFIRNNGNEIISYIMNDESKFDYKLDNNWSAKSTVNYLISLGINDPIGDNGIYINNEILADNKRYIYTPSFVDNTKKGPSVIIVDNNGILQLKRLSFTGTTEESFPKASYKTFYAYKNGKFVCGFNNDNDYLYIFSSTDGINFNFVKKERLYETLYTTRILDDYVILNMASGHSSFSRWKILINDNIDIQKTSISTSDPNYIKYYNSIILVKVDDYYYINYNEKNILRTKDFENYECYDMPELFKSKIVYTVNNGTTFYLPSLNVFVINAKSKIDNKYYSHITDSLINPTYIEPIEGVNAAQPSYYDFMDVGIGKIIAISSATHKFYLTEFNPEDYKE